MADTTGYIQSPSAVIDWTDILAVGGLAEGMTGELLIRCNADTRIAVGVEDPVAAPLAGGAVVAGKATKVLLAEEAIQSIWIQTPASQEIIKVEVDDQSIDAVFPVNGPPAEAAPTGRIVVTQSNFATTLGATIDSSVEYFITGWIDTTGYTIEVPAGGINIRGYTFDISGFYSDETNHVLFSGANAGNLLMIDMGIAITGTGSKVYSITSNTGFDAFEVQRVNYNDCVSLGTITNYRQGLETGTGRFGGTPEMELVGTWVGGFVILTSIVRGIDPGSYSLFKAGAGFNMASRFKTDMNVDLPAGVSLFDFAPAQFANPSTVQLNGMIITRSGLSDIDDALYTPNMTAGDLPALWQNSVGIRNTYVGGKVTMTAEAPTTVGVSGTLYELNDGTWTTSNLQHFDSPSNGILRHIGTTPVEYRITIDCLIEGGNGDEIRLELWRGDFTAIPANEVSVYSMSRLVNNFQGGRDVAFFNATTFIELLPNDYIFISGANDTDISDVTLENGSTIVVEAR